MSMVNDHGMMIVICWGRNRKMVGQLEWESASCIPHCNSWRLAALSQFHLQRSRVLVLPCLKAQKVSSLWGRRTRQWIVPMKIGRWYSHPLRWCTLFSIQENVVPFASHEAAHHSSLKPLHQVLQFPQVRFSPPLVGEKYSTRRESSSWAVITMSLLITTQVEGLEHRKNLPAGLEQGHM